MVEYKDWYGTPNWSERRGMAIRYIIIHDTEGSREAAFAWWTSPANADESSAHDLIDAQGVVWRCVPYDKAAHHAGDGHIPGFNAFDPASSHFVPGINSASIGIELEYPAAPASPPWPQVQLDAAVAHVRELAHIYGIPRENIYRHATIDPTNRSDPRNFPWEAFLDRVYAVSDGLAQAVIRAAWQQVGVSHAPEAPLSAYAREQHLGNPETGEFEFVYGGQRFRGQGFRHGIVYARADDLTRPHVVRW